MRRWHEDRARSLRKRARYLKWHGVWYDGGARIPGGWKGVPFQWDQQLGRFRKGSGIGCPDGRKCGFCSNTEPTRQQIRADLYLAEVKEASTCNV